MKEKTQLKERSPSQQEQSIKETNTIGLQFNYLIPSMGKSIIVCVSDCVIQLTDNLDCLSDVQVAEKKLFLVQGRKSQLMNWEQFGLRIGIEEDSLLSSETVEVATAALVGGQFKFPKNTVLVSAVYAVSISEPLLIKKPLRLEMQHCVDLRGRPGLSQYLKFAIAPVSTPSLPYQFRITEGGEFSPDSRYGSIQRKEFCLVGILGQTSTNGVPVASVNGDTDEEEEEEQQQQQEEEDEEQRQEEEEEVEQRQEEEEVEQRQKEEEEVEQRQEEEEVEQRQEEEKVEQRHEEEEEVEQRQEEEEVEQQQKKEEVEQRQEEEGEVEQRQEKEEERQEKERQEEEKEELQQQEDEQEKEEKDEQQQNGKEDKTEEDDDSSSDSSSESNKTSGPPAAGSGAKG